MPGLLVYFLLIFSLQSFSQTTEQSTHPLMDKYYPPKSKTDTIQIVNEAKPATMNKITTEIKPVESPADISTVESSTNTTVSPEAIVTPVNNPQQNVTDSVVAVKPSVPEILEPVQKKTEAKPESTPYRSTRLGSSSRLYKTWETNNSGAGSVTTGQK